MSLRLLSKFASVSLQGRPLVGLRRYGVPPGGAMDQESLALVNALLGRSSDSPAYEVTGGMTEWIAEEDCTVAIVGAAPESTDGQRIFQVGHGESFKVALGRSGFTYYIGSSAGHLPERKLDFYRATPEKLRVVRGPQCDLFTPAWREAPFQVTNQLSRAGFRLTGSFDTHAIELPSEPACPGAIQVTPDGNAIILGPDGPTIGGYPKVAVVCSCDLDQLAHLRPGSQIHFEEVFIDQAKELHRDYRATLAKRVAQIRLGTRG